MIDIDETRGRYAPRPDICYCGAVFEDPDRIDCWRCGKIYITDPDVLALCDEVERLRAQVARLTDYDAMRDAIGASLGDAYDCARVWSAWSYGTMTEDDFRPTVERVDDITDEVIATLLGEGGIVFRPEPRDHTGGVQ